MKSKKIDKNIFIYHIAIGYMTVKVLRYATIITVKPSYISINKINGYIEESNGNKKSTPVFTDESKAILKKHEELWNKIRDLLRSIANNSNEYNKVIISCRMHQTSTWKHKYLATRAFDIWQSHHQLQDALDVGLEHVSLTYMSKCMNHCSSNSQCVLQLMTTSSASSC